MPQSFELPVNEAQTILEELASVFLQDGSLRSMESATSAGTSPEAGALRDIQARYRSLVEQIPAVVFMVYLDRGIGEAYVSPHIESTLGFSQAEWLEDPVRWYRQIHPEDNLRWSEEAAHMFLTGNPLRSVYRVLARDGRVVWFHCEAKMVRSNDGQPWFIHGVAIDVSELKRAEEALQEERNFVSTILDTVGTLILVLDLDGRVVRFNRACEQATGLPFASVRGRHFEEILSTASDREHFRTMFEQTLAGRLAETFESHWTGGHGARIISWSATLLPDAIGRARHVIASGADVSESKRLQQAILDISEREQHRIGSDLHDGLGQHLTGIAFMSKVLEQKLAERAASETKDASKIVKLVNEAVRKTRELSRGLLPVASDPRGLMSALERLASEVENVFGVSCPFECDPPVFIQDHEIAGHLYSIAQEAVNNAIKHGSARSIIIKLADESGGLELIVIDDGLGMPENLGNNAGMGLHIMNYRARMIGGTLHIGRGKGAGTSVRCQLRAGYASSGELL